MAEAYQVRVVGSSGLVDEVGDHRTDIGGGDPGRPGDVMGLRVLGERSHQPQVLLGEVGDVVGGRRRRYLSAGQYGVRASGSAAPAGDAELLANAGDVAGERRAADAQGLGALAVRRASDQVFGGPLLGGGELGEFVCGADLHRHGRCFRW